jgi:hypothetical protein
MLQRVIYILKTTKFWRVFRDNRFARRLFSNSIIRNFYYRVSGSSYLGIPDTYKDAALFFHHLEELNISYVVLRWFDRLPEIESGGDIDFLISEADFMRFRGLLTNDVNSSLVAVDICSDTGFESRAVGGIPYYPPELAGMLLNTCEKNAHGIRVPNTRLYLNSLVYHALYHKGFRSGLHSQYRPDEIVCASKYHEAIAVLCAEQGVNVALDMESLEAYLEGEGWMPSLDTKVKLSNSNSWVESTILLAQSEFDNDLPVGSVVFFVRESHANCVEEIRQMLCLGGVDIRVSGPISKDEFLGLKNQIRGGAWPDVDGGGAVHYFAGVFQLENGESLLNRTGALKYRIREKLGSRGVGLGVSVLHSSDTEFLAAHHLRLLLSEGYEKNMQSFKV